MFNVACVCVFVPGCVCVCVLLVSVPLFGVHNRHDCSCVPSVCVCRDRGLCVICLVSFRAVVLGVACCFRFAGPSWSCSGFPESCMWVGVPSQPFICWQPWGFMDRLACSFFLIRCMLWWLSIVHVVGLGFVSGFFVRCADLASLVFKMSCCV